MTLPAHLQRYQAPDVAADLAKNLGSAMPPHVSIGGGRFTLIDASNAEIPVPTFDPAIGVYLDAVIIGSNPHKSRVYFSGQYDPNAEGVRPDCFSDNGVAPSTAASSPQSPTCAACPQAVWGSKISAQGKKIPACSEKQKVALLIPGMQTLFLLAVPPNSHSYLSEYVQKAMGSQVNIADVITRISFVPGIQGTLTFKAQGYIDEPTAVLRQAAYAEKKIDALVGKNDVPRTAGQVRSTPPQQMQVAENHPNPMITGPFVQPAAEPAAEPQPTRRRRRTAAEMQATNGSGGQPQGAPAPAAAPQAPFPVRDADERISLIRYRATDTGQSGAHRHARRFFQ